MVSLRKCFLKCGLRIYRIEKLNFEVYIFGLYFRFISQNWKGFVEVISSVFNFYGLI